MFKIHKGFFSIYLLLTISMPSHGELFRGHGNLVISPDKTHIQHTDGKPFLWMGDTAWFSATQFSFKEWQEYIRDRASKNFTVVQILLAENKNAKNINGEAPLLESNALNPSYFEDLDNKIEYANQHGIAVLIVGSGSLGNTDDIAQGLVQYFSDDVVMFSPAFDDFYNHSHNDFLEKLAAKTKTNLLVQHPNNKCFKSAKAFYLNGIDTLNIAGLQSGHAGPNRIKAAIRAIDCPLKMYNLVDGNMPVINLEAIYDGRGMDGGPQDESDARRTAWLSWLSGALGYTYGAGSRRVDPNLCVWCAGENWKKAINFPSSIQMKYLYDFFNKIEWWKLSPDHQRIINNSSQWDKRMALSTSRDNSFLVAYLQNNKQIEIDLSGFQTDLIGKWYDPLTGKYTHVEESIIGGNKVKLSHSSGEKVLLITAASLSQIDPHN